MDDDDEVGELLEKGSTDELVALLEQNQSLLTTVNEDGRTVLQVAIQWGNSSMVDVLLHRLSHQLSLNHADSAGWTALHQAASLGWDVNNLLQAGADPNITTTIQGTTALHYASSKGHERTLQQLLNAPQCRLIADQRGQTAIHRAAILGRTECVRRLLEVFPSSVNDCDADGNTPLHLAAEEGHPTTVRCLLECGADPNILNLESKRPAIDDFQG